MEIMYDICVDSETLCNLEYKIDLILHDLAESIERMTHSIQNGQEFLAGNQFEKARQTTTDCINMTQRTQNNLKYAKEYLKKLQEIMMEYGQCTYRGEGA